MLTSIRKVQKVVLIVVTAIICVAFAWLYNRYEPATSAAKMTVDGMTYRIPDALRLATNFNIARYDLGMGASMYQPSPLGEFAAALSGNTSDRTQFVANLIILRNEAKRMGIEPSAKEIQDVIRQLPKFQNPATNQFDPTFYANYLKNELGRYSKTETDLYDIVGDSIKYNKLRELVAAGHKPTKWEVDQIYETQYETFEAHEVALKRDDFKEGIKITDEAAKAYYDENRDSLFADPKRSMGYIKFAKEEKKEEETEEEFEARRNEQAKEFNETYKQLVAAMDDEGKTFEEAIATKGDDVKTVEPFAQIAPPEKIADQPELVRALFAADPEAEGADKLLAADEEKAIYMFWVDEVVDRAQKTFEEAKEEIITTLTEQEISARLEKAANEAREKILANLKEGTDFPTAAKAAGYEVVSPKPFSRTESPEGTDFASTLARVAYDLEAGELSEPESLVDGMLLVYLADRSLPERETEPEDRQRIADSMDAFASEQAFRAWFQARVEAANPTPPMMMGPDGELQAMSLEEFARS